MASKRRAWALDPEQYKLRLPPLPPASANPEAQPAGPARDEAVRREATGVTWQTPGLTSIDHGEVERARHRFRASLPELVWNAAALEGNAFTLPEVKTLLDGVTVGGRRSEDEAQILALSEAYSELDEMVGDGSFALTKSLSDRLHGIVARHEAIEAERFDSMVDYLSTLSDPRERALAYFAAATRTQFYFDGNKRTARLMMTGELLAHGFDAVNIPYSRRLEFNRALDTLFSSDDGTDLLAFLVTCSD